MLPPHSSPRRTASSAAQSPRKIDTSSSTLALASADRKEQPSSPNTSSSSVTATANGDVGPSFGSPVSNFLMPPGDMFSAVPSSPQQQSQSPSRLQQLHSSSFFVHSCTTPTSSSSSSQPFLQNNYNPSALFSPIEEQDSPTHYHYQHGSGNAFFASSPVQLHPVFPLPLPLSGDLGYDDEESHYNNTNMMQLDLTSESSKIGFAGGLRRPGPKEAVDDKNNNVCWACCAGMMHHVSQPLSSSPNGYLRHHRHHRGSVASLHLLQKKHQHPPRQITLQDLPPEILTNIYLMLPLTPTRLSSTNRHFRNLFVQDEHVIARWLIIYNQLRPSLDSLTVGDDLKPSVYTHPLLACLKHASRYKVLEMFPKVAKGLLVLAPFTSRYDLQRIYRRAVACDGLKAVAELVSERAVVLFGAPVGNTVAISKNTNNVMSVLVNLPPPPPLVDDNDMDVLAHNGNGNDIAPAAEMDAVPRLPGFELPEQDPSQQSSSSSTQPVTVDDRRALLDAAAGGDTATVGVLVDACALVLDARIIADAFSRAWDRGDPQSLCLPTEGWLWPRCQASRYLVLEKLAKEEDDTLTAVATATATGTLIRDVSAALANLANVLNLIVEEGVAADLAGVRHRHALHNMGVMPGDPETCELKRMFSGCREFFPGLWTPRRGFLERVLDGMVAYGSARMVMFILSLSLGESGNGHGNMLVKPQPRHLTVALDRGHFGILELLLEFGADAANWEEDPCLNRHVRRPPSDSVAAVCWRRALSVGVPMTTRRWDAIVKLGPRTVSVVVEMLGGGVSLGLNPRSGVSFGMRRFDPCRDRMVGFRLGNDEVVRCLSDFMDSSFDCGDALAAAAFGDSRALLYVRLLGGVLADAMREGDKDRVCDLLDAGAIVLEDGLSLSACIADAPPGEWDEWPIAARCYRRILAQRRLRLPIPSRQALTSLPDTVVNKAFLASLFSTRPILDDHAMVVYARYQRRRHANVAGIRINLVPVLEHDVSFGVVQTAMENLRGLLTVCDDPAYPGEAYCFIKGMLQYGLRDKNLLRDEDEFFLPDDEWDEVATALMAP
ncbi:hypothetical protein HDU76_002296 [Blyttiomyces sp. JEL0837]|nr:hypothetical protein HDU76_002296 [Blyttiomyces sp. JEL0837]